MQRLGDEDLCGHLLNPKNYEREIIESHNPIKLQAINAGKTIYTIADFHYIREAKEPLFPARND